MAESPKQLAGLDKNLLGAKIEPGKESKRKRKSSKEPPAQAHSNETLESQSTKQESVTCVEQNVAGKNEDPKLNAEGTSQMVQSASDTSGTANISREFNPPDNEKMTKEETTGHGDLEECMNKDDQQDLTTIQEQGSEGGSKFEQVKQDHASSSKFGKFAFHRSKKVKISMKKSSFDEDKQTSDPLGETTTVKVVTVEENTKNPEQQVYQPGEAKFETSPGSADIENEDASKSPKGIQEKPQSKNNKGKKLKQLANFGRNKKKYEIAFKLDETSNETNAENLVDTPGRFQRSRSTSSQPFQNTEIVGNESKEPVAATSSDFNNENTNDGKDEGTEIEKKRGGKQKKKGPVLGFKRSKPQPKTKPSKSEDKQNTKGNPSKESDVSVSAGTRSRPVGENKAGFEESNEDSKANKSEAADLKTEEKSSAAAEMTQEISDKEETNSVESKEIVPPAHGYSTQVTPKGEKKENILRRRLRRLKSPGNILQGRKKSHEDENSVESTGDGVKTAEQVDKGASSELEQTAEEQTPVDKNNDEKECSDNEGTSQAVKRKTSDLKTTRALKKKKGDGENIIEVEFNEELSETALTIIEEKDAQNIYEEVDVLSDLKSSKEIKDLTEVKEQSVDEVNKEMSQRKNVMEEPEENKQRQVDEEISSASLASDDTKTEEEVSKEARRKSHKLMQTVINELTDLIKKKEESKAAEIEIQVEEREERANFSDRENAVTENQQLTSVLDDTGLEHEPDEESYDSDVTVVTVKTLSSHESLVEHKTEANTEDEEVRAIAEEVSSESETSSGTEPPVGNESKPDTKDEVRAVAEEVPLETKTSQVTETPEIDETKPNTEDKEIGAITEVISKGNEAIEPKLEMEERPAISEDESSREVEAPRESESASENETKQETEEGEIKSFTEEVSSRTDTSTANHDDSQVHVPKAEAWAEHKTDSGIEPEEIHDINEAGETSQTEPNQKDSIEAVNINPGDLVPESRAEQNTKPATEGEDVKDFTDASKSSPKFKGRMVQVKVLNESEVCSNSDELETITKANEVDDRKEEEYKDVGQSKEVESYQATSCQNSVEEWIMVHQGDLTEEISRQIKHSLVFNSLRRSYTSCCTIM